MQFLMIDRHTDERTVFTGDKIVITKGFFHILENEELQETINRDHINYIYHIKQTK